MRRLAIVAIAVLLRQHNKAYTLALSFVMFPERTAAAGEQAVAKGMESGGCLFIAKNKREELHMGVAVQFCCPIFSPPEVLLSDEGYFPSQNIPIPLSIEARRKEAFRARTPSPTLFYTY
ncbi:unnamed protein product [Litomosoides sigmodontis]|uniref:Uncharacterized protein n=1 Tax=Litomosoides sigmodontis TaxID=42156 RepID=A0A3P6U3H9_LITSI|nr:unnamed protein product [Litomosoides sigmodontis]